MTTRWGKENRVNPTSVGIQYEAAIAAQKDGRYLVAWTDNGGDEGGTSIQAQLFNADGSRQGAAWRVNDSSSTEQSQASICPLADGGFVVAWSHNNQVGGLGTEYDVRAQIFNADGSRRRAEFRINTVTTSNQHLPDLTPLAGGGFIAVWQDYRQGGLNNYDVWAQTFDAQGVKVGAEWRANGSTANIPQAHPLVVGLSDGQVAVVWLDKGAYASHTASCDIHARVFSSAGAAQGEEFQVNVSVPASDSGGLALAALGGGAFVAAWVDDSQGAVDLSGWAVRARVMNADGSARSAEFLVNTTLAGNQWAPAITALPDQRFVIAWQDDSQSGGDTSGPALRAQVFEADGSRDGTEFLVNTTTLSSQEAPALTTLADGRFAVVWTDTSAGQQDVRQQIFDPRILPVTLGGTSRADHYVGTAWNDALTGGAGHDTLDGGGGLDTMDGGTGNDTFSVSRASDIVIERSGQGDDLVRASVSYSLVDTDGAGSRGGYVERLTLTGDSNLTATGNTLANTLTGNAGANRLDGKSGNDTLAGAGGADTLTGGMGADRFRFVTSGEGLDVITDFSRSQGDKLIFVSANFGAMSAGNLASSRFRSNTTGRAGDGDDRFIFETDTKILRYDRDGTGAAAAVRIAQLNINNLAASDIQIVAS